MDRVSVARAVSINATFTRLPPVFATQPSRLCFVLAVATLVLTVQGQQVVASGKRRWVDCHWQRGNSYLRIGWSWIKGTFHHAWCLFPTLALQGRLDPDPAFASNKQVQNQFQREFTVKS